MWVGTFLVQNLQPRGKTKLILTVKMETIHPVEEPFGSEFPATCNHCGVMTADGLKSKDLEFLCAISRFFLEKRSIPNFCYSADRAQNLPGPAPTFGSHCSRFHSDLFTFGGVIAERVKTVFAP